MLSFVFSFADNITHGSFGDNLKVRAEANLRMKVVGKRIAGVGREETGILQFQETNLPQILRLP